jgi:hypothetical protein
VPGLTYEEDPAFYRTSHRRFPYWKDPRPIRRAWRAFTGALNDAPFRMRFPNLDPSARYRLRVVYSDTEEEIKLRLEANAGIEVHPWITKADPRGPVEFDLPYEATCAGEVTLSWFREPGRGGLGAGHELSEIWLLKL